MPPSDDRGCSCEPCELRPAPDGAACAASSASLAPRRTRAVDIFRSTPTNAVCPNFYVLGHANGCGFAPLCSYCYLKSSFWYLRQPRAFGGVDRMLAEVRTWIARDGLESFVLNTGNLSDSLAFEAVRPLIGALVELFRTEAEARGRPHCLLLVTKGGLAETACLAGRPACRNVIVSFSVNAEAAARAHETGAPPPAERLDAAGRLQRAGWRVRLRLDPMIHGHDYGPLIARSAALRPERVTLGSLRAEPHLLRRVPGDLFKDLERPEDPAALARYPWPIRLALYRPVVEALRTICDLALCEEPREMWDALGLDAEAKRCNCAL